MKIYRKKYIDKILSKVNIEKLFLLVGARQVWKTTILNILNENLSKQYKTLYFNFEDVFGIDFKTKKDFINYFKFEYNFDFYEESVLFLDEVQYLQNPESLLKSLYDDKEIKTKIIATWSRFWGQKKVWSSLVWRWEIINVYPLDFFEFLQFKWKNPNIFDNNINENSYKLIQPYIKEYKEYGWYPAVVLSQTRENKENELKKIIDRTIEKDFIYFMKTDDIIDFKKIFQFIALNTKNIIKIDAISQEFSISRYKVKQFIKFLEDSFLIYSCYPYYTDKSYEYNKHPEIFFNDLGFLNYISWTFNTWNINENFTYLELLKSGNTKEINYYHKKNWSEIDFIITNKKFKLIPIEVKSSDKDNVPIIFKSFYNDYQDKIDFFVVITKSKYNVRKIKAKKIIFIPSFMIWNII